MHRLAREYPERAVSWFGIGCYYACIGRHADARRYFGKATGLDPAFPPAWLGFGHAFAAQDESDQVPCPMKLGHRLSCQACGIVGLSRWPMIVNVDWMRRVTVDALSAQ